MVRAAIIHEGNAEKTNDNWLLKELLASLDINENSLKFYGVDSKSNFFKKDSSIYQRLIPLVTTDQLDGILFVIDADYEKNDNIFGGYQNTLAQWNTITQQLGIQSISNIYITCDPRTQNGYLESLLLSTLDEEKVNCIANFLNCSQFKSKDNHKSILNQIYKTAYPNAPFDLKHPHFDELKQKLRDLVA